jgi:hypothetical protein
MRHRAVSFQSDRRGEGVLALGWVKKLPLFLASREATGQPLAIPFLEATTFASLRGRSGRE